MDNTINFEHCDLVFVFTILLLLPSPTKLQLLFRAADKTVN